MLHALNIKCSTSNYKWSTLKLNLNVYQYYIAIAIKELCGENSIFTYISRYKYINNPGYSNFTCTFFFSILLILPKISHFFFFANLVIHTSLYKSQPNKFPKQIRHLTILKNFFHRQVFLPWYFNLYCKQS